MAYQPIQMPQPEGLGGLAEFIMQARNQGNAENARRAELLLRQKDSEDQAAHRRAIEQNATAQLKIQQQGADALGAQRRLAGVKELTAALDAGRPDLAQQIAKTYGLPMNEIPGQGPRDALMKPSIEIKDTTPQSDGVDFADQGAVDAQFFQQAGFRQPRGTQYEVDGQKYDPEQVRVAQADRRSRDIEQVRGAFGPLGYGDEAAALAGANTADRPIDVSKLIATRMERDNTREATQEEKRTQREFQQGENEKYRNAGLGVEDRYNLARIGAAAKTDSAGALAGPRQDQGDLQSRKYVDETISRFEKTSGIPKLLTTTEQFNIAAAELKKPSGAAQVGARMAIERALRGGPPTQYMDEQEQKHLSGIVGRLEGALETLSTGQFGEEQKQAIAHEIDAARAEYEHAIDRRYQSMAGRFKNDPAFENLQGTVNNRIQQTFAPFGRQVPEIYPGGKDRIGAIGSRSVAGSGGSAPPETVGLTDDINSDKPLPEDPNAEELPAPTKLQAAARTGKAKNAARANSLTGKVSREDAIEEARRRGLIP